MSIEKGSYLVTLPNHSVNAIQLSGLTSIITNVVYSMENRALLSKYCNNMV